MKGLGAFVTRSLWQAGFCALLFALLPFLSWIALVIVALITLQKSPREGFLVVLWACLPSIAMAIAGWHGAIIQAVYFCTCCVMVWGMAWLLRLTSWSMMLQLTTIVTVVAVVILRHWYAGFAQQLQIYISDALAQAKFELPQANPHQIVVMWSQHVVRLAVVSVTAFSCLWLALGRWWQTVLFNPGQLQSELHNIRLNKWVAAAAVTLIIILGMMRTSWLLDLAPVIILPFSIAGLSLLHSFIATKQLNTLWLWAFYIALVLAIEIVAPCLAIAAVIDSWVNFRQRWQITRG